jgi:hypothetical protein
MKTPTNHEDNQLFREAAKRQNRQQKREREIDAAISRSRVKLIRELMDDFNLGPEEIARRIREAL